MRWALFFYDPPKEGDKERGTNIYTPMRPRPTNPPTARPLSTFSSPPHPHRLLVDVASVGMAGSHVAAMDDRRTGEKDVSGVQCIPDYDNHYVT